MTQDEFQRGVDKSLAEIRELLITKGGEYAPGSDALVNFKEPAQELDVDPFLVLQVFVSKHYRAIRNWIEDWRTGKERARSEPIHGRIRDVIVYMLLLEQMIAEALSESEGSREVAG